MDSKCFTGNFIFLGFHESMFHIIWNLYLVDRMFHVKHYLVSLSDSFSGSVFHVSRETFLEMNLNIVLG